MSLLFIDPVSGEPLVERGETLVSAGSGRVAATRERGKWRFVPTGGQYARSFGWQWARWSKTLSDAANNHAMSFKMIMSRTGFDRYELAGKSLLECGCGSGNDTEILQKLPLGVIKSFDLSNAVDFTAADQSDPRLEIFQADLTKIPYPDRSFDVVYCHRVLQHTPDPEASLRAICRKVKPGGLIFAHCYNSTKLQDSQYHHKYRWLTRHMPFWMVAMLLTVTAPASRAIWQRLGVKKPFGHKGWKLCFQWLPLHFTHTQYDHLGARKRLQIEKLITFDRLTAWFENHLTGADMRRILESEGFQVDSLMCDEDQPVWATAVKTAAVDVRVRTAEHAVAA